MNQHLKLSAGLISALLLQAAGAAVNINGITNYVQSFNALPTGPGKAEFNWTDNTTIPGFYLHRTNKPAGTTNLAGALTVAASRPYISDGALAANAAPVAHGFLSLGAYSSTERALGFSPTGADGATNWAGGTLSIIGIFTNAGTRPIDIGEVAYDLENWRGNTLSTPETVTVTYKTGNAAALLTELETATGATFTIAGYQSLSAGLDLSSADGFTTPARPGTTPLSATISPALRLQPGQSIALRWGNVNDDGADAQVGIDNLRLTLETPAVVDAALANVVRQVNGTPTDPANDTVDFSLTVNGFGNVSATGYIILAPASLAGQTGTYGTPKLLSIPIGEFPLAEPHTLVVEVSDSVDPALTDTETVTAAWCALTPVITNLTRDTKNTADPADDTWDYTFRVNGQFTGTGWTSDGTVPMGNYATDYSVQDLSINSPTDTVEFTDKADANCKVTMVAGAPRIIGTKNLGFSLPLLTDGLVPQQWQVNEAANTQLMNNAAGVNSIYRSEVIDLSAVGIVRFSASLLVNDTSTGNETVDTFNAQLIINGDTANPVSLITPYDTLIPADRILTGAEITPATGGPPPVTGGGTWTHQFSAVIPASANSVQLVISGNNDSLSENMTMQNILFELGTHSILLQAAAGVQFDNKGTIDPADDTYRKPVNITGISLPPGSTGWISNSMPASGLYSAANPVSFGPFLQSTASTDLTLSDNGVAGVTQTIAITPPTPAIFTTFVAGTGIIQPNGAGPEDDTATFEVLINAPVGGPEFVVTADYPGLASASSVALSPTQARVTVTLRNIPDHGFLDVFFADASYPLSRTVIGLDFGTVADASYIIAKQNLGNGLASVFTAAGSVIPIQWQNFAGAPGVVMTGGGGTTTKVLTSEVIDLSAVAGAVNFTANLRAIDRSAGFEDTDTFLAELIINGNTAVPVNLITTYDKNNNGVMNGGAEAADDEFNAAQAQDGTYTSNFPLSFTIPDSATSVQLIITAVNDSANETFAFANALFTTVATPVVDTDGDGASDASEAVMGTDPANPSSILRLSQDPALTTRFNFPGVAGRFYRVYRSGDATEPGSLTGWVDAGIATQNGAGNHSVNVQITPGIRRRFYFLRVMLTDGPWPATLP